MASIFHASTHGFPATQPARPAIVHSSFASLLESDCLRRMETHQWWTSRVSVSANLPYLHGAIEATSSKYLGFFYLMPEIPAEPTRPTADSARAELIDMIQRFLEYLVGISERMPFTIDRQKFHSITTLAALSVGIFITWKLLRAPPAHQRRQLRQSNVVVAVSGARSSSNSGLTLSEYRSSSAELRPHDRVDELFQPGKRTLEQIIRHRLNDGRKVTCQLLGVILEETTPDELQEHATVKSSVRELLLEIPKFCDLYLMERILDDESGERIILALKDAGLFTAGGLNSEKVLFCSTENGRISFVRQLEPDWHIDTNPDIIHQLARFIKYQLHISPTRIECAAANVFSATSLEHFFGILDRS